MSQGWIQFLLVGVPVLMLVSSWLALKHVARWHQRRLRRQEMEEE